MLTLQLYLQCGAMFIGGQILALMFITVPDLRKKSRLANKEFSLNVWWTSDWNIIIGTQVIGIMLFIGLDQLISWKPWILPQIKWIVAGLGAFGTPIIQAKFSPFAKGLSSLLDIKSNAADILLGKSNTAAQVASKYEEVTGNSKSDITSPPNPSPNEPGTDPGPLNKSENGKL